MEQRSSPSPHRARRACGALARRRALGVALAGAALGLALAPAAAAASTASGKPLTQLQKGMAFYRGKTITIIEPGAT
ncbi:MAG: hypothetical protein ACRD6W_08065, partial [Nitrososphaerales archaeon]